MNHTELIASLGVTFDWTANEVRARARFADVEATTAKDLLVSTLVSRNYLVATLQVLGSNGYSMSSPVGQSVLREIAECDEVLALHGEV